MNCIGKRGIALTVASIMLCMFACGAALAKDAKFTWDRSDDPSVTGYKVHWGNASRTYSNSADAGNNTEYTLTGIEEGKEYYFTTTAYNSAGTESDYSNEIRLAADGTVESTPQDSQGQPSTESSGGGGGCFIATAAYGSYMEPEVMILRDFRDRFLLKNPAGRLIVQAYYSTSPPIADFIRGHEFLRAMVRWVLTPVVFALNNPVTGLFLTVLMLCGILVSGRAMRQIVLRRKGGSEI